MEKCKQFELGNEVMLCAGRSSGLRPAAAVAYRSIVYLSPANTVAF